MAERPEKDPNYPDLHEKRVQVHAKCLNIFWIYFTFYENFHSLNDEMSFSIGFLFPLRNLIFKMFFCHFFLCDASHALIQHISHEHKMFQTNYDFFVVRKSRCWRKKNCLRKHIAHCIICLAIALMPSKQRKLEFGKATSMRLIFQENGALIAREFYFKMMRIKCTAGDLFVQKIEFHSNQSAV